MPNDATVEVPERVSAGPESRRRDAGIVYGITVWVRDHFPAILMGVILVSLFGGVFALITAYMATVDSQFNRMESQFEAQFNRLELQLHVINEKLDALPKKDDVDEMKERLLSIEEFLRNGAGSGVQQD